MSPYKILVNGTWNQSNSIPMTQVVHQTSDQSPYQPHTLTLDLFLLCPFTGIFLSVFFLSDVTSTSEFEKIPKMQQFKTSSCFFMIFFLVLLSMAIYKKYSVMYRITTNQCEAVPKRIPSVVGSCKSVFFMFSSKFHISCHILAVKNNIYDQHISLNWVSALSTLLLHHIPPCGSGEVE